MIIEGGKKYRGKEILNRRRITTDVQDVMGAQYSIPYAVAVTLFRGRPGVQEFSAGDHSRSEAPAVAAQVQGCETGEDSPGWGG